MAYYSSSGAPPDNAWYPDTAATNHVTSDLSYMNLQASEYMGDDQPRVDDGNTLPIHHIGSSTFTPSHSNFILNHLLHVPHITKNLVSVKQFCEDNNVYFQFHSRDFFVKDAESGTTLLRGSTSNGLYMCPSSSPPQAFLTSVADWHVVSAIRHYALSVKSCLLINFPRTLLAHQLFVLLVVKPRPTVCLILLFLVILLPI